MSTADSISKFDEFLTKVRLLVSECKEEHQIGPETRLLTRWKTDEFATTETGVTTSRAHLEYIAKEDWFRGVQHVLELLKTQDIYSEFRILLTELAGKDVPHETERASTTLIAMVFEGRGFDPKDVLKFLVSALRGDAIPAWSDIDVWGIKLKTKAFTVNLGKVRLTFRQLDISDFEEETIWGMETSRSNLNLPPSMILRLEMEATRGLEMQQETEKILTLLRLFAVGSIDFGRQAHGTDSPFPFLGGHGIGGTLKSGQARLGNHEIGLTDVSQDKLQDFLVCVGPRLPKEIYSFGEKKDTPLTISYERYCEGLFCGIPVERKIAACVMGLEALFFQREEMQELSYRLSLRVSKVLSKLDFIPDEVHRRVKISYRIRSLHVHGSHLSAKERKEIQKTGISPEELAVQLLDYLRISILHLIFSGQTKMQFLNLIEESLVIREKDDALGELLKSEAGLLCRKLP